MALRQTGDIPAAGNDVEQVIEKYTNIKLKIQWIPQAAFNDKINIMIASNDMPKIMKVNYVPAVINAIKADVFWEVGPYLKDYKNLAAQNPQYYDNIQVDGKVYGIPNYRDIGRAAVVYRKDWFDAMGLKLPTTMDEWYTVLKALATGDPDKNGKNDTYGTALFKGYNDGTHPS
ncbi:extracellular solute-binding protein [Paenibacillus sp. P25]|nr:extracellular solute-binding protein [Paenibacillus sp. P25]